MRKLICHSLQRICYSAVGFQTQVNMPHKSVEMHPLCPTSWQTVKKHIHKQSFAAPYRAPDIQAFDWRGH